MKHKRKKTLPVEYIFVWVGDRKNLVDGIAPRVGKALGRQFRIRCMFCNASNIKETAQQLKEFKRDKEHNYKVIAFDVGFCNQRCFMLRTKGIRPASFIDKQQDIKIGDISYIINIDKVYEHLDKPNCHDLLLENYVDKTVQKQVNRITSKLYKKLYALILSLGEL